MDIGLVNSVTSTSEVKSVKNTAYTQDSQQKVDYSNYSIADLRKIPYEEAKSNYDAIINRSLELDTGDSSAKELAGLSAQLASTKFSDNESINKSLYGTMQNITDGGAAMGTFLEINQNLRDYAYGKEVKASFEVSNDAIHTDKGLTKSQINSIDFSDFISKMVSGFSSQLSDASKAQDEVKKQYQNIVDSYSTLQKSYENEVRKPYYA
jgi:hypothetical protein